MSRNTECVEEFWIEDDITRRLPPALHSLNYRQADVVIGELVGMLQGDNKGRSEENFVPVSILADAHFLASGAYCMGREGREPRSLKAIVNTLYFLLRVVFNIFSYILESSIDA